MKIMDTRRTFLGKILAALGLSVFAGTTVAKALPKSKPIVALPSVSSTEPEVTEADSLYEASERSEELYFNEAERCYYYPSVPERPPRGDSKAMIVRFKGEKGFQLEPL
jgi:hypothetical protein